MENEKIKWCWFLLMSLIMTLFSCATDKQSTITYISSDNESVLTVTNVVSDIVDSLFVDNQMVIENTNFPLILMANNGVNEFYVYLEEGDRCSIETQNEKVFFYGDSQFENELLQIFDSVRIQQIEDIGYDALYRLPFSKFKSEIDSRIKALSHILKLLPNTEYTNLRTLLFNRITAIKRLYFLEYQENYELLLGIPVNIPDSIKTKLIDLSILNNEDYLLFREGRLYIKQLLTKTLNQEYNTGDYYLNLFSYAEDVIPNKNVSTYLQYTFLREHLHLSDSIQVDYVVQFINDSNNNLMNKKLVEILDDLQRLAKGAYALDFSGRTVDGLEYNLEDFKGRWIYLDVWAMWCAPCYGEFSYFRDLAATYGKDRIVFVGLSVDEPDEYERWQKFIDERGLGGLQLFGEQGWQSLIMKNYNIENIPRYILIDPDGKIADADAPWASNWEIRDFFENL
jgi:peroxiredoxin